MMMNLRGLVCNEPVFTIRPGNGGAAAQTMQFEMRDMGAISDPA